MSNSNDTLNRAYGNMPKEVGMNTNMFDFIPYRPVKYFWLKWIIRKFFR